jgi:hypothetical protein
LFGAPCGVTVHPPQGADDDASERIVADVYEAGMVEENEALVNGSVRLVVWAAAEQQARLKRRWGERIDIK